uniref:AAA+ ATPase domain-containing protein n=1 Tax=Hyaloperonospora arabidopsidis (strain Emoy2) TaxID=559515 RepID=M4BKJ3_HYAAE
MPRRSSRLSSSAAVCGAPTARQLATAILSEPPSKESLDNVAALYVAYLSGENSDRKTLECLEELDAVQFLERALWPLADVVSTVRDCHYDVKKAYLVSVLLILGFKARRGDETSGAGGSTGVWSFLSDEDKAWKAFVTTLWTVVEEADAAMEDNAKWTLKEQTALTQFLITCFQSLDVPQVASSVLQMTSLPLWTALSPNQRALEFQMYPKLERHWNRITSDSAKITTKKQKTSKNKRRKVKESTASLRPDQTALVHRLDAFFQVLKAPVDEDVPKHEIASRLRFVALFLALLIDLLSQLPTRRFLLTVLRRRHVRTALRNSLLMQHSLQWQSANDRQAISKQLSLLDACMRFPVDAHTGLSLSPREYREHKDRHIQALQQRAFQSFRGSTVEELAIAPCSHIANTSSFTEMLTSIVTADRLQLSSLAIAVGVLADQAEASTVSDAELIDFFKEEYSINHTEQDALSSNMPVYPTELDIWNPMLNRTDLTVQNANASGDETLMETVDHICSADESDLFPVLPVRKLGLQFLNVADYLQRNYELLQLEAAQDIREDLESTIRKLDAVRALRSSRANDTVFRGFSRFGVPLVSALQTVKVGKPSLGQVAPASVIAELEVNLSSHHDRKYFDCYQTKEVVFLVTVRATADEGYEIMGFQKEAKDKGSFPENFGVQYVRAAEVVKVTDAAGCAINDENPIGKGSKRAFTLALDGVQYKNDLEAGHLEAYEHVNLLVRRRPRDNNFKAVLDTISGAWRNADKEELLPAWLHDLFLGYGDPAAALYKSIYKARAEKQLTVPMSELLLDGEHALEAGGAEKLIHIDDETQELSAKDAVAPFTYVEDTRDGSTFIRASRKKKLTAEHSSTCPPVRFTKAQVAAVRTGFCEGLTLVVGPPGTGKTDVAVQLVLNLYRFTPPREKVLIVAHSNQALNDFFSKILAQNVVHEAEIVRMGQRQLTSASGSPKEEGEGAFHADFSRNGRVAFLLERRIALLAEVEQMAQWLIKHDSVQYAGLAGGSTSYSCANALVFYQFHMKTFLDAAREATALGSRDDKVAAFSAFFATRKGEPPSTIEALRQFAVDIESYFAELRRLQPFELLQTPRQRGDMYLIHHARIIAMTCTHAALNYSKIADLGLQFGSLVVEEAAQVSELDSIVPLLLTCSKDAGTTSHESNPCSGLQRVVLMGDAKQLPPVVKSLALKSYAHFDQSLFNRLLRLGVPHIVLDRQGRSRSEIADIYRWRYDDAFANRGKHTTLGDLPRVKSETPYQAGNVGFSHVAQFVDLSGTAKERQSKPFAYENEEEARFIVALFRYMLHIGYRADQVAILSTYNAQNELLQRLLRAQAPEAAKSCQVSTVDRFQGQQNDFVLLSTVRSGTSVGHLRDVRRATTAFSRARLGLYVVGCLSTLEQAQELQPFVSKLVSIAKEHDGDKATKLALVPWARVDAVAPSKDEKRKVQSRANHTVVYISDRKQLEKVVAELEA